MTISPSGDAEPQIDTSQIAAVRARYRRASDTDLQDLAAAGRESFTPWAWQDAGGQSIGKKHLGLMVVSVATNEPCSLKESGYRAIVMTVLGGASSMLARSVSFPPLESGAAVMTAVVGLVEPIMALATPDGRRLGDRIAGTQVITADDYAPPAAFLLQTRVVLGDLQGERPSRQ